MTKVTGRGRTTSTAMTISPCPCQHPDHPKHTNSVERAPWPCQCSIHACPLSAPLPPPQAPLQPSHAGVRTPVQASRQGHTEVPVTSHKPLSSPKPRHPLFRFTTNHPISKRWHPGRWSHGRGCSWRTRGDRHLPSMADSWRKRFGVGPGLSHTHKIQQHLLSRRSCTCSVSAHTSERQVSLPPAQGTVLHPRSGLPGQARDPASCTSQGRGSDVCLSVL